MAAGTKIIFEFKNASGNTVRHSYNYGDANSSTNDVRAYMQGAITNNSIFDNPPTAISRAYAQVTTETEWQLNE